MTTRWGLGPVFALEWLTTSRRWQVYAGRALFVGVLLLGLASVWASQLAGRPAPSLQGLAEVGRGFYNAIVFTQLTLVLLAAPAATAGALCQDKTRGNLATLLITDLSDPEIVLGKLAARLVPVLGLVACALPVLAIGTLLGGIDPLALTGTFLITVGLAVFGCTLTLTFSVWGSKPYEVLLATFAVFAIWLLAVPVAEFLVAIWRLPGLPDWLIATNPYLLALAPYVRPGKFGMGHFFAFTAAMLALASILAALAIARMRAVVVGQADRSVGRAGRRGLGRRPALDRDPALWYEWHRKQPSPWTRTLIRLYFVLAVGFSLLAIYDALVLSAPLPSWLPAYVNAFAVVMGLPLMVIAATTALVEERARGSLDVLLATPLSSRSILLAKWWSVFRETPRLLVLPALVGSVLAWGKGTWWILALELGFAVTAAAAWTSVGLALSTWVPRLGRAISAAVVLFTLVSLGWPILILTLCSGPLQPIGVPLACISPFYGMFYLTVGLVYPDGFVGGYFFFIVVTAWVVIQSMVAVSLLLAVLATFDRCLGRIPERNRRQTRSRGKLPIRLTPASNNTVPGSVPG